MTRRGLFGILAGALLSRCIPRVDILSIINGGTNQDWDGWVRPVPKRILSVSKFGRSAPRHFREQPILRHDYPGAWDSGITEILGPDQQYDYPDLTDEERGLYFVTCQGKRYAVMAQSPSDAERQVAWVVEPVDPSIIDKIESRMRIAAMNSKIFWENA